MTKCCICGTLKNCAPFLTNIFANIERIGSLFDEYRVILSCDISTDDTVKRLQNTQADVIVNTEPIYPYRTWNIARGRNLCLQRIREKYSHYDYFIMMDCDEVCTPPIRLDKLSPFLGRNDWDALSFKRGIPGLWYYDMWALSIGPCAFSDHHYANGLCAWHAYFDPILQRTPKDSLIPCQSAFNGFAIYRTHKFIDCEYDGHVRLDLINPDLLRQNNELCGPPDMSAPEDCEHRAFHLDAIRKHGARIMISPVVLFGEDQENRPPSIYTHLRTMRIPPKDRQYL